MAGSSWGIFLSCVVQSNRLFGGCFDKLNCLPRSDRMAGKGGCFFSKNGKESSKLLHCFYKTRSLSEEGVEAKFGDKSCSTVKIK